MLTASGPDEAGIIRTIRIASPGARARNPGFDVTPASLIAGIVTEKGILPPTGLARIRAV